MKETYIEWTTIDPVTNKTKRKVLNIGECEFYNDCIVWADQEDINIFKGNCTTIPNSDWKYVEKDVEQYDMTLQEYDDCNKEAGELYEKFTIQWDLANGKVPTPPETLKEFKKRAQKDFEIYMKANTTLKLKFK